MGDNEQVNMKIETILRRVQESNWVEKAEFQLVAEDRLFIMCYLMPNFDYGYEDMEAEG